MLAPYFDPRRGWIACAIVDGIRFEAPAVVPTAVWINPPTPRAREEVALAH